MKKFFHQNIPLEEKKIFQALMNKDVIEHLLSGFLVVVFFGEND